MGYMEVCSKIESVNVVERMAKENEFLFEIDGNWLFCSVRVLK